MRTFFREHGFDLAAGQIAHFETYTRLLVAWNRRINLTAIRSREDILVKHFLDSLTCLRVMPAPIGRVVDVGSGAGFPGLVLKIARPEIRLTLIESVGKKADFCRLVVQTLGLRDVEVVSARAEEIGQDPEHREQYDWAVARAVAGMPVLAEYLLPLVRVGGRMLAQKGAGGMEEAERAESAIHTLGGRLARVERVRLPGVKDDRTLIVIQKVSPTPSRYPRRVGVPSKRPLS